jgi:hypothetical protein
VLQLEYQAPDDPEEFPGLKAAELASFNEVQLETLDFALTWSRQDAKKADAERALCLGLCVNLEDDDEDGAGLSQWRGGNDGQGCSTWAAKDGTLSDDDDGGKPNIWDGSTAEKPPPPIPISPSSPPPPNGLKIACVGGEWRCSKGTKTVPIEPAVSFEADQNR